MKKPRFGRIFLALSLAAAVSAPAVFAAPAPPAAAPPIGSEAGTQLNQSRQYLQDQELKRRLKEEQAADRGAKAEGDAAKAEDEATAEVSFTLKKVNFDESSVLSADDLEKIAAKYLNREIKIADLYALVGEVNDLYKERGYIVCRAYLPPQTISGGAVRIGLVEGRTGEITVEGNKATAEKFIKRRINLTKGEVSNLDKLNKSLIWFNGTNDVQLRIRLQAGKEPGTTDYVITAAEPRRQYGYYLLDTAGAETTGIWRLGLGYVNTSLMKQRDQLSVGSFFSQGTRTGSFSYNLPITKSGTRFGLSYSANSVEVKRGAMKDLHIEGDSSIWAVNLSQPLAVTPAMRVAAFLEYNELRSKTDFFGFHWVDDKIKHVNGGLRFTHYGKNTVLYHEHTLSHSGADDNIVGSSQSYMRYNLNLIGQKLMGKSGLLTLRAAMQMTGQDYIVSSDQFYIGGVNSVRGYKENILSGDKGYNLSLEYSLPQGPRGEWIYFLDYGRVSGANAYDDDTLIGYGAGYRHKFAKDLTATLLLGLPTKRTINGQDQGSCRLHFTLFGQF